jgi:flagellar FliL protein
MASKPKKIDAEAEIEADEEDGAKEAAPKPKKQKPPLKLIIIAAAALLVLGAGGTGVYFVLGAARAHQNAGAAAVKPAVFFDLPDVLVNLSNTGGERTQYLKIKVVLELPDQAMVQQVQPVMPRVMDAFQTYLRELRPTDLEGSAGLYRLKEELTRRVNAAVAPSRINAVLFKEIIVQ